MRSKLAATSPGVMQVHRAIVRAACVRVLDGVHEAIVALLSGSLSRAACIPGHDEMLKHSLAVHGELVDPIARRDRTTFDKLAALHDDDLVRADDPARSPHVPSRRGRYVARRMMTIGRATEAVLLRAHLRITEQSGRAA